MTKKKVVEEPEAAPEPEAVETPVEEPKAPTVGDFRYLLVRDDAVFLGGAQDIHTASRFADEAAKAGSCTVWVCEVGARHT